MLKNCSLKTPKNESTLRRYQEVYAIYEEVLEELGDLRYEVSKAYIYTKVQERVGLCTKTIAFIINYFPSFKK